MRILGNSNASSNFAVYATGGDSFIHDIVIDRTHSGVYQQSGNIRMFNVSIFNMKPNTGVGININQTISETGMFDKIYIHNADGSEPYAGILIKTGSGLQFVQCEFMHAGTGCLMNPDGVAGNIYYITFTDCYFDNCINQGVLMSPVGANGAVVRTRFLNCWFSGNANGLDVRSGKVKGITISGCDIYDNVASGISIHSGANVQTLSITSSNISDNGGSGISIGSGVSDFIINANKIGPSGDFNGNQFGVYIDTGATKNYIITNNIKGNTNGQLVDGGTGTSKVVANNVTN